MWTGKPVSEWTEEEKNIFFDKLKNREIEGLANYFGTAGFFSVKDFMEKELPKRWNDFLDYCHVVPKDKPHLLLSEADILNAQLNLTNLITFLLDNQEWVWKECEHQKEWPRTAKDAKGKFTQSSFFCEKECNQYPAPCQGTGKVKHPAMIFAEGVK
jgi:hypothetical protein